MFLRLNGILLIAFASLSFFFVTDSYAQGIPAAASGLELTSSTDQPIPGQELTITANSYSASIDSSKVTWTVNGKVVQSGTGLKKLNVKAPELGKRLKIEVTAVTPSGAYLNSSMDIGSGSVDMVVETDGYVHQFYSGKMPIVFQNSIKIIAVPHLANSAGVEYDPKTLVYQWKKNDRVISEQSGYGKQFITLEGDIVPRQSLITVNVTTKDRTGSAMGMANVEFKQPEISFYINDPLYGPLFNRTVTDVIGIGSQKETTIMAVPFGFNKPLKGLGNLQFDWQINGNSQENLNSRQSVVLRAPDGVSGSSNIELSIKNKMKILQGSFNNFSAIFNNEEEVQSY